MAIQRTVECPECGEEWTIEKNSSGKWNPIYCPRCSYSVIKEKR